MTPYKRGRTAGWNEAVEREHNGDATIDDNDPSTWFVTPAPGDPVDADLAEYERGWNDGWNEYFAARV